MALRDSKSELGASLGSLTPRIHVVHERESVEQNSGLVDMRALYAASVEHVRQRAQAARPRPPVVALQPVDAFEPVDVDDVVLDEEPIGLPRRRLGWLPMAVVLLALASAGGVFVANSNVPEAVQVRATVAPAVMRAQTTLAPVAMRAKTLVVGAAMRGETGVVTYVDRLMGWPVPVAAPVSVQPPQAPVVAPLPVAPEPAPAAPPVVAVALPTAVVDTKPAVAATPAVNAPAVRAHGLAKAPPDHRTTTVAPKHAGLAKVQAKAAAPVKASVAEAAPEPAPVKATTAPAKTQAPAASGADSKPMSLEDMIRRSVEADSKHKP